MHAMGLAKGLIALKRARVTGKILVWSKLSGVYEDGSDHGAVATRERRGTREQGGVSGVKGAHGGHQNDGRWRELERGL
jgi:hypothetical protein